MSDNTPRYGLGRIQRHDPRSRAYRAPRATTLRTIRHRHYGPVLDQGSLGSCTGNAMAQWLNCQPAHKPRTRYLTQEDAIRFYSGATRRDPWYGSYPPDDTGSSGIAVCQEAQALGLISSYTWAFGLQEVLAALVLSPVLLGTVWKSDMFSPLATGFIKPTGSDVGGHEYLLTGINITQHYVWALNSWGPSWGLRGRFKIHFSDLDLLLRQGGDAAIPML